jgi:hypothetical protein
MVDAGATSAAQAYTNFKDIAKQVVPSLQCVHVGLVAHGIYGRCRGDFCPHQLESKWHIRTPLATGADGSRVPTTSQKFEMVAPGTLDASGGTQQ